MTGELSLTGGATHEEVVRVGDTVRRPARGNPLMREVLAHLERVGFDAAPRWLGVDDQGRDVLTWIDGDTFTERSQMHPYIGDPSIRITFSDAQLTTVMRLLRRYHDTFDGEVVCHGDFSPWNIVWREEMPVAVIDFDDVYRGAAADDVGYALRTFVGYGLSDAEPEELVRRTRTALAGYGADFDVPRLLGREYDLAEGRCRRNGWHRQLERLAVEREWLVRNRVLLEAAR